MIVTPKWKPIEPPKSIFIYYHLSIGIYRSNSKISLFNLKNYVFFYFSWDGVPILQGSEIWCIRGLYLGLGCNMASMETLTFHPQTAAYVGEGLREIFLLSYLSSRVQQCHNSGELSIIAMLDSLTFPSLPTEAVIIFTIVLVS